MPRVREGVKILFAELPGDLVYRLQAVAKISRRTVTGQTTVAVEEHLARAETPESRELARRLEEEDAAKERERKKEAEGKKPGRGGRKKGG